MTAQPDQRCVIRGLYYRLRPDYSVILLATLPSVQSSDLIAESYEMPGGDEPLPPFASQSAGRGNTTQSGRFLTAAMRFKRGETKPEKVKIYQYVEGKSWQVRGFYKLLDAWREERDGQKVYVFKLEKQVDLSH